MLRYTFSITTVLLLTASIAFGSKKPSEGPSIAPVPKSRPKVVRGKPPEALDEYSAGKKCDRDRKEVNSINSILQDVESGKAKAKSVDEFLSLLPDSLRSSMLFTADSHSIQESNIDNPRVILKSPNSEVTLSFSSGKGLRGSDAVELQIWDAEQKRFKMVELRFPDDTDDPELKKKMNAEVTNSPDKCVACHGGGANSQHSARPVFDPYRQWSGFIPFSEDRLNKGSPEVGWFKSYLKMTEDGKPRMRQLKPLLTTAEIDAELAKRSTMRIPSAQSWSTQDVNTPGLDMSHQFLVLNGCRVVADLKRDPARWNAIKYALAGANMYGGCEDPASFLNPEQNEAAEAWFQERGIGKKGGKFNFESLVNDTKKRGNRLSENREASQLWFLEKALGSAKEAEAVVALADKTNIRGRGKSGPNSKGYSIDDPMITSKSRFPTFENHYDDISKTRYLLDPLGFETNLWSMAVDPETFAHVEFFDEIAKQPEVLAVMGEANYDCKTLAEKSRAALKHLKVNGPIQTNESKAFCPAPELEEKAVASIDSSMARVSEAASRDAAAKAFANCYYCHAGREADGAPYIPFDNMSKLKDFLQKRNNKVGNFSDIIWDRITRSPESYNAMPLGGSLREDEKIAIRTWLNSLELKKK